MTSGRAALACAAMLALGACAGHEDGSVDDRLVRGAGTKGWIEVDTRTAEGQNAIAAELIAARSRVMPLLASRKAENSDPIPVGDVGMQDTRPTTQPSKAGEATLTPWPGSPISMVFNEASLKDIVAAVASEMNVNVVVPQTLTQTVSVNFPKIDPLYGLDLVLREHDYRVIWESGVLRVAPVDRPQESRTFVVRSNRVLDTQKLIKPLLTEHALLVADDAQHSFTVTDDPRAIARVSSFLETVDTRLPQVLIEAIIIEIHRDRNCQWGSIFDLGEVSIGRYDGVLSSNLPAASPLIGSPPFEFGLTNADNMLKILLSGQKGKARLNVLSNPIVTAISGEAASIEVIRRVPYVKSMNEINVAGTGASTNSSSQIEYEDVGVKLKVTPEVGADQIIRMKVEPIIRELVDFRVGTPVIDERKVVSSVLVRDNETLVIGGLYRSGKRRIETKSPIFGDIPIIGDTFFSNVDSATERVELLLFVTPHIVAPGEGDPGNYHPRRDMQGTGRRFDCVEREAYSHPGLPEGTRSNR